MKWLVENDYQRRTFMKGKKTIANVAAVTIAASTIMPSGLWAKANEKQDEKTQLIIKYKDDQEITAKKASDMNLDIVKKTDDTALVDVSVEDVDHVVEKLEADRQVDYVEENATYTLADDSTTGDAVDDTYYENQWNLSAIDVEGAWQQAKQESDKKEVKVAVLDTGVSMTHDDLNGRVLSGETFLEGVDPEAEGTIGEDDQGHGTFVSGIIAANANNGKGIAGVAGTEDVEILPVKVMNKSGVGDAFHIAQGIEYAIQQGVDVINMSLSGEYSEAIDEAVQEATQKGIVVVAAAGNGGGNADTSFPAALDNVISVGAIAKKDQVYEGSNVGETVDLVAPGVGVTSTSLQGDLGDDNGHYTTGTGTSYATPHVAAVAALYKAQHQDASVQEVTKVLTETATDLDEEGRDNLTGYGKVNAAAALTDHVEVAATSFTAPKKNANVVATTPIKLAINNHTITKTAFFVDDVSDSHKLKEVETTDNGVEFDWDTTQVSDGEHTLIAVSYNDGGSEVTRCETTVKVQNHVASGYMFHVKTPTGTIAKGATVRLFEKGKDDSGQEAYTELWSGATDQAGALRVPSYVGTDLKDLQVVVQGKFDAGEGENTNSWFMYAREISGTGAITLESENTVPVKLKTVDETSSELTGAQYFISMKDKKGITLGKMTAINTLGSAAAPTVYLDKGAYNIFSYAKHNGNTYFLSNTKADITANTSSIEFTTAAAGEVEVDNQDKKLENAVLYLYNDDMTEALGTDETATGRKFFVSPGDYRYMVDAEVKDTSNDGKGNWIYIFADDKKKATVTTGNKTTIQAGGSLDISNFKADQEAIERYAIQRGVDYIERDDENTAYKADQAFYTTQTFSDAYGNQLVGMYRGSLDAQEDAIYKKDVQTGETSSTTGDDEWKIEAKDFGDIYPNYRVTRVSDSKVMADSNAKNPTNPANRMYYMYAFTLLTSADMVAGQYRFDLIADRSPLAPQGLTQSLTMDLKDSGTTMDVVDQEGNNVPAYITLNRVEKDEHGEYEWTQFYGRNTDAKTKDLSIPDNLKLSTEKGGNVAIIRYTVDGKYAYIYRTFDKIEDLDKVEIPNNMQEVTIKAMDGDQKLDKISTKLWMIKQPVSINGETTYVTANNLQVYKYDSIYLEPADYVIEGNYVSMPDANGKQDNYYFIEENAKVKENAENIITFDKAKLAKLTIDADAQGYSDVRGAIVYPYNKYSDSFTKTLRTGYTFYLPTNLEMNVQVQLGLGDPESKNKIWNYFLTKGQTIFTEPTATTWKVGGQLQTSVNLKETTVGKGAALSGTTAIQDAYGNNVSSVLVNQTNDYSIAEDEEIVYKQLKNGQIEEQKVNTNYSIAHSVPTAAAESVKPVLSIVSQSGEVVSKKASLDFYSHVIGVSVPTVAGTYYAKLAIAGSPLGATTSNSKAGMFTVSTSDHSTPEVPEPETPVVSVPKTPTIPSTISDKTKVVRGTTTPNATVVLKKGSKIIAKTKADKKGNYQLTIPTQTAGTTLTILSTLDGKVYSKTKTIKVKDQTAPKVNHVLVTDKSNKITVKTEKGATIKLTIAGKNYIKKANKSGTYTFTVKNIKANVKWSIIVTDAAGNAKKISGIVKDKTAPKTASILTKVTKNTKHIIGKAEKNATVYVYKKGKKIKTAKVSKIGKFTLAIPKQKTGTVLSIIVKDKAGNKSKTKKIIVKK